MDNEQANEAESTVEEVVIEKDMVEGEQETEDKWAQDEGEQ